MTISPRQNSPPACFCVQKVQRISTASATTKFTCLRKHAGEQHQSQVTFKTLKNIKEKRMCISLVFLLSGGMKSINPLFISFIASSLLLGHLKTPKGKLLVLLWKIFPRKKWLQLAQSFVFPLNKATDKANAWCMSIVGAWACSRVHKQSNVSQQTVFFTVTTPPGWEYNVLQHITASGQYLICSSML